MTGSQIQVNKESEIMKFFKTKQHALAALAAACMASAAQADEALSLSGFASLVGGKVISGERDHPMVNYPYPCPCFIADYGHGALYGPHWTIKQESKVGVQASYAFTPNLSATAQVVGRGVDNIKAGLEWAYLSYDVSPTWTVQVGRKRLPIYYYSDFQDVGYAYTWVRPPADIYGWEVINYNGINATYRSDWWGWAVKSNLFGGREDTKNNLMQRIYYDVPQDLTWKHIIGGDLVLTRTWLTTRLTYIQSDVTQREHATGVSTTPDPGTHPDRSSEKQSIYGIAFNADIDNWFVRSEYSVFDRSSYSYKSHAYMLGVGARWGKFTPMLTHTRYKESNKFDPDVIQHDKGWSMTVRYELTDAMALKVQYDTFKDMSGAGNDYVKDAKLMSISLDTVF